MVRFQKFGGLVISFEVLVYAIFLAWVRPASPQKGLCLASLEEGLRLDPNRTLRLGAPLSLNYYD